MKPNIDYRIYLVTDHQSLGGRDLCEAIEQAILGGCTLVQIREKNNQTKEFYDEAIQVKRICDRYNIPLIVNDRIDIALAIQASGVHVGQSDLPANVVRKIVGDDMVIGVSVTNLKQAIQAREDGADYLGVGAMHPTGTKSDATLVSKEELARIRRHIDLPIVVIGGIGMDNARTYANMHIDGFAVVSAILGQSDIQQATEGLRKVFVE
ncbi:thiamine-phosphate diphosphorylase [Breznakia blatticola]|uniref:Thiamine-phosphate synthase n=1 Tax=Breznakia blatticola TaxID=1754012 RepID=A0A4R8A697_9FIRM|nr:thiamine phosphate synthase [Breznakia blatticola]TDW25291.1 thiamine-phosphate diphosphorylase [Breznakia blatticola]